MSNNDSGQSTPPTLDAARTPSPLDLTTMRADAIAARTNAQAARSLDESDEVARGLFGAEVAGNCALLLADEVERLRAALAEALDEYEYAYPYKGEYLAEKHGDAETVARLRALLPPSTHPAAGTCEATSAEADNRDRIIASLRADLRNMSERYAHLKRILAADDPTATRGADSLPCPWDGCAHEVTDLWDWNWYGRDAVKAECDGCGRGVEVTAIKVDGGRGWRYVGRRSGVGEGGAQ